MLFTTAGFAFLYLPVVLLGFLLFGRFLTAYAAAWLFAASVFFYGYWMPQFTLLLVGSVVVNFTVGRQISASRAAETRSQRRARAWMVSGILFNLVLLGYFKYANFFIESVEALTGSALHVGRVLLPIGISFFTFTQIAFLADAYQKGISEYKFTHYGLFVTYFPHLVAGPVLHHAQMMPQFGRAATYRFQLANLAAGCAIFALGLLKKVVIADGLSPYADCVFDAVQGGGMPSSAEAWLGALAYTLQLYFDFSGYSDMAIGLSWMFNVRLPFNFNSPYKARNISDFWRRWHMTLSTFLRDYLYIPLGGNRRGPVRRYVNLAITMLLGGLWHGASWTFVFWGGLHGAYLAVNHAFQALTSDTAARRQASPLFSAASWLLTLLAVIVAWVFFRAATFTAASRMLQAMFAFPGAASGLQGNPLLFNAGLDLRGGVYACIVIGAVALFAPNSNAIGEKLHSWCRVRASFRALTCGFALVLISFLVVLNESRDSVSAFIYFNF
jgi:alginate O-acetyltransferase complex protein AlgI